MTLLKPAAAGLALAALIAGAAVAGGDKTKTSAMSSDTPAATGKASDTAATSRMTAAEMEKMRSCKAMSATAMAADAECRRLSDKYPGKAAKPSSSGAAATGAPPQ